MVDTRAPASFLMTLDQVTNRMARAENAMRTARCKHLAPPHLSMLPIMTWGRAHLITRNMQTSCCINPCCSCNQPYYTCS